MRNWTVHRPYLVFHVTFVDQGSFRNVFFVFFLQYVYMNASVDRVMAEIEMNNKVTSELGTLYTTLYI